MMSCQAKNITNSPLLAVRFSPDYNSILTLSAAGRLQQWSTKMFGTCMQEWAVHGGRNGGYQHMQSADLCFSHTDKHITTSSVDGRVPLYDIANASSPTPSFLACDPETRGGGGGATAAAPGRVVCVDWHPRYVRSGRCSPTVVEVGVRVNLCSVVART